MLKYRSELKNKKFMKKTFQEIEKNILDIILPKKCFNCQVEKTFWCKNCFQKIKLNSWQICPICQKFLTEKGEVCLSCKQGNPPIDSLTVATSYQDPLISKSIQLFKYKFIQELSEPLSKLILKAHQKNKLKIPDLIIPVPLHPFKLRWRGFNQSQLLAENLATNLLPSFPIKIGLKILTRVKYTFPQASFKKSTARQKNIRQAFQINLEYLNEIKNHRILLIDDVCTTGSTLMECGQELRKLKPKSIQALVIARQN